VFHPLTNESAVLEQNIKLRWAATYQILENLRKLSVLLIHLLERLRDLRSRQVPMLEKGLEHTLFLLPDGVEICASVITVRSRQHWYFSWFVRDVVRKQECQTIRGIRTLFVWSNQTRQVALHVKILQHLRENGAKIKNEMKKKHPLMVLFIDNGALETKHVCNVAIEVILAALTLLTALYVRDSVSQGIEIVTPKHPYQKLLMTVLCTVLFLFLTVLVAYEFQSSL
jgi:hypothetical protein